MRIETPAYAKVNFTLEVLGKRGDGYHEIVSIMQTVSLHDTVTLEPADEITLSPALPGVAVEENLAYRAALLLTERSGVRQGAHITLEKAIPQAAGLGGGSSNAAAVLGGLNRLWGLAMSDDDLAGLGAEVGSDVPFFVRGGTAMVSGRGERVRPLPPVDQSWLVLLCPEIPVADKTAAMYSRVTPAHYTGGLLTRKLEARIRGGGDARHPRYDRPSLRLPGRVGRGPDCACCGRRGCGWPLCRAACDLGRRARAGDGERRGQGGPCARRRGRRRDQLPE